MNPWFVVWTRSRHERYVCDQLALKRVVTFLPTVRRTTRWSDRVSRREWPLFPGYCFVQADVAHLYVVQRTAGVVTVLSQAGVPSPVPDAEVTGIQRLVSSGLAYEACPLPPLAGECVRVVRGPLVGTVGRFLRQDGRGQLLLAVDLLKAAARLWVDPQDIEPLRRASVVGASSIATLDSSRPALVGG